MIASTFTLRFGVINCRIFKLACTLSPGVDQEWNYEIGMRRHVVCLPINSLVHLDTDPSRGPNANLTGELIPALIFMVNT